MKEIEEKFMTQGKFTSLVEDRVKESNGLINYIEGCLLYTSPSPRDS